MKSSSFFPRKCPTAFRPCCIERMEICLAPAGPAERDTLYRLLQYSLYEESAYDGNQIGEDALFPYSWFDAYFMGGPSREAWLIRFRDGGKLLGFAMVNTCLKNASSGHSIAEFMILPPYRRQGAGRAAALACFQTHSGTWEVSPAFGSDGAFRFWERTICGYIGQSPRFEKDVFIFFRDSPLTNAAKTL